MTGSARSGSGGLWAALSGGRVSSEGFVAGVVLVDPAMELSDTRINDKSRGGATAASQGDNINTSLGPILLTDQRTTRVTLKDRKPINKQGMKKTDQQNKKTKPENKPTKKQ